MINFLQDWRVVLRRCMTALCLPWLQPWPFVLQTVTVLGGFIYGVLLVIQQIQASIQNTKTRYGHRACLWFEILMDVMRLDLKRRASISHPRGYPLKQKNTSIGSTTSMLRSGVLGSTLASSYFLTPLLCLLLGALWKLWRPHLLERQTTHFHHTSLRTICPDSSHHQAMRRRRNTACSTGVSARRNKSCRRACARLDQSV